MRNAPAFWSVVFGVLSAAAIPAAVAYADRSPRVELVWAGAVVPVAALLGLTDLPPQPMREQAAEEGWIHLPLAGSLGRLAALAPES